MIDNQSIFTGDDLSHLLNPHLKREDTEVEIEYRYERGKKVRVISAPKEVMEKRGRKLTREVRDPRKSPSSRGSVSPHEHHHEIVDKKVKQEERRKKKLELQRRKGPVKPGSRPQWGYKNTDSVKPKKQSEKDPFYERKKLESEMRRQKREQKLLSMVEANKEVIPDYYVPPPRSRSHSRDPSPFSDIEMASPRQVKPDRRSKSHSPNRYSLKNESQQLPVYDDVVPKGRGRDQSQSPAKTDSVVESELVSVDKGSHNRHKSPPVPALRHKQDHNQNMDIHPRHRKGGRYGDVDPLDAPIQNGDFVPFTRTIEVLDPTKAEEPMPLSREATRVANARRAYYEGLHPEKFGNKQYVYVDKHRVLPATNDGSKVRIAVNVDFFFILNSF